MASYFLIAGEASGDVHGAALVQRIHALDPDARIAALGGDKMEASGCFLYQHIRHMAFMGFAAVLSHLGQVRRNFRIAEQALLRERPDVLILIDYPSFNLRMASFCRKHLPSTKICYYIPPKVWAWKRRRIHRIARLCDEVLGIFPFEPAFYAHYGYRCTYVGHPTVEEVNASSPVSAQGRESRIVLLPGSRASEVKNCLPRMLEASRRFPGYQVAVVAAPGLEDSLYMPFLLPGEILTRDTYGALQKAAAGVVNSGTATLEAALLGCPQVAVYHLACSRWIGLVRKVVQPLLFSIRYFTPVNIIAGKEVIKECIADTFTVENVEMELRRLLSDEAYKKEMLVSYDHLRSILGTQPAAATAAALITTLK